MSNLRTILLRRRHTYFLGTLVGLFFVRPLIGEGDAATLLFSVTLVVVMLAALLTIQVDDLVGERRILLKQRRRRQWIGWSLALIGLSERVAVLLAPSASLVLLSSVSWCLFFGYVTWSQLRSLLKQKEVTGETISMSVAIYLMMGATWGLLYVVIFERQPEAFHFADAAALKQQDMFVTFIYFSLTTLSTVGFGDITPVAVQARYAAVAEGIAGQLYLTILVARLVGVHIGQAGSSGRV